MADTQKGRLDDVLESTYGKPIDLQTFFRDLDFKWTGLSAEPDVGTELNHRFEVSPEEFLEFANRDLETSDKRALANALSNSKRAIDCQIEKVFRCIGLDLRRQNFPEKCQRLESLGIVAPRIIRKVVEKRNYLEHEFKCPVTVGNPGS